MNKKSQKKSSYNKYRTLILPKQMVDLLFITSQITPMNTHPNSIEIGLTVINDILSKSNIYKQNNDYDYHVIPMSSYNYLKVKYGNDYSYYIKWLVNNSVIWNDNPFEGYSSHYYLHSMDSCNKLIQSKLKLSELNIDDIIHTYCLQSNTQITLETFDIKGINDNQKNRIFTEWYRIIIPINSKNKRYLTKDYEADSKYINNAPKHIKAMGAHYRKNIDIDFDNAIEYVNNNYARELMLSNSIDEENKAYKRYTSRVACIHSVKNGKLNKTLRFNRNETNKRLDTNLTNMASDLRPFIIGYENMAYLDLVNSQPVLFNAMLISYYDNATESEKKELDEYRESTTNGQWYEKIMEIFKVNRNEAKSIWMEIAYSKNKSFKHHKKIFQKKFPFISSIINKLKENNHANFSIELQKIESKVFIDKICKDLVKDGIFPYTMHDGLLVPRESMEKTKEIMLVNLKNIIGAYPKIKVE